MDKLSKRFLSENQIVGKCLICNKDIGAIDASGLTHNIRKTLTNMEWCGFTNRSSVIRVYRGP